MLTRQRWRQALSEGQAAMAAHLEQMTAQEEAHWLESLRRSRLLRPQGCVRPLSKPGPAANLGALQGSLAAEEAVVVYHQLDQRLLAGVVTSDAVHLTQLPVLDLAGRLRAMRQQIDTLRLRSELQPHAQLLLERARTHGQALHDMLWRPVQRWLRGRTRVVVVPHKALHYLPFAALHDGAGWLVQRYVLSLAPGLAWAQAALAPAARRPTRAVVVGLNDEGLQLAEAEAAAVAQCLRSACATNPKVELLCGPAATQAQLRQAVPGAELLHVATHGRFRADNPMFSAVALADGPLTMHEASTLGLQGALVTLSACETGVSRLDPGNEAMGLVRGFLRAGASAVVASQWAVSDSATASLMQAFYQRWLAGSGPAEALAQAQALRAEAGDHPFHWAAFALHGQGGGATHAARHVFSGR
jgi:CHAT domain-containing protein